MAEAAVDAAATTAKLEQQSSIVTAQDYFKSLEKLRTSLNLTQKDMMTTQWVNIMIQRIQDAEQIVSEQGYSSLHENIKTTLRTYMLSKKDEKKTLILKPIPGKEHRSKTIVPLEETYDIVKKAHNLTNRGSSQDINAWLDSNNIHINEKCAEVYCKLYAECVRKAQSSPMYNLENQIAEIESAVQSISCPITSNHDTIQELNQLSPQTSTAKPRTLANQSNKSCPPTAKTKTTTNKSKKSRPLNRSLINIDSPATHDIDATKIQDKQGKQDETTDESKETLTTINNEDILLQTVCSVDVLDISENPDNLYQYLLVYQDKKSNYIQLRPLNTNTEANIAVELIKIFMDFGPPTCLVVDEENLLLYLAILERIKTLTKTEIRLAYNKSPNPLVQTVAKNIIKWTKEHDCSNWGTGCFIVQWNMNNTLNPKGNTPYAHVFGYKYTGSAYKSKFHTSGNTIINDSDDDLNIALDDDHVRTNIDQDKDKTIKRACNLETDAKPEKSEGASNKAVKTSNKSDATTSGKADEASDNDSYIVTVSEHVVKSEITDSLLISEDSSESISQHVSEDD